jgi:hypothetical protein
LRLGFRDQRNNAHLRPKVAHDNYIKPPFLNRSEFRVSAGRAVYIPKVQRQE